jgi:hypothetical protein
VGICWQGNPTAPAELGRSIPLNQFRPLGQVPGVRLISLQKKHGLDQLARIPADMTVETLGDDFDAGPDAFVDCAAVMQCLDLVVTSDTAVRSPRRRAGATDVARNTACSALDLDARSRRQPLVSIAAAVSPDEARSLGFGF